MKQNSIQENYYLRPDQFQTNDAIKKAHLNELQQFFSVTEIFDKGIQDQLSYYQVTLIPNLLIKMVISKDYPQIPVTFYVQTNLTHYLIDENTWKIKYEKQGSSLKDILFDLKNAFTQVPPTQDPYVEEIQKIKNKINEEQLIQKIQQVDIRTLFKGVQVNDYKKIVENGNTSQYIEQLPEFKQLTQYIIELTKTNENLADHLIEQDSKLKQQRAELSNLAAYFERLKVDIQQKQREYSEIKNNIDPYYIVRKLEEQIDQLDELSNERVESMNNSTIIINRKFDEDLQSYFNLRKQHHKLQIKKEKLEQSLLQEKRALQNL